MKINVINKSTNPLPHYETERSAGMDLRADLQESLTLNPMERSLVKTGLFIELPRKYEAQIRPRSGMALKQGITVLNAPGTIDADYRGEIGVILINLSSETQIIQPGDRIAQIVFSKVKQAKWEVVDALSETERGDGGFGSTGKH